MTMLVGGYYLPAAAGNDHDGFYAPPSPPGFIQVGIDFNNHVATLVAGDYLRVTTFSFAQFSSPVVIYSNRVATLTDLSEDSGYRYRMRRTGGDELITNTMAPTNDPVNQWSVWRGGSVASTQTDYFVYTLFSTGSLSGTFQLQVENPESSGTIIYDQSFSLSLTYP